MLVDFFLSSIESHSHGEWGHLGELNLELSSHSVEWGHLVKDQDVEPIQHWGNNQALGELNFELSNHFVEWEHLVKDQDVEPVQH